MLSLRSSLPSTCGGGWIPSAWQVAFLAQQPGALQVVGGYWPYRGILATAWACCHGHGQRHRRMPVDPILEG
jgi:hypothetical protein